MHKYPVMYVGAYFHLLSFNSTNQLSTYVPTFSFKHHFKSNHLSTYLPINLFKLSMEHCPGQIKL